jgi:HD superfamily phosphohydrolase
MQYVDAIYGEVEITENVLLDVIASATMQRLKGVSQHGITALLGITPPFSRFEHSLGAMLLVRRLGAGIDEQIAALLHDISHTAFSHVIDFVFDDHSGQSYHEEKKEELVARSDIPTILQRHGLDWRDYLDEAGFSLLEQPSPALCANRLDYFLRDLEFLKLASHAEIRSSLTALEVRDGKIVVNNPEVARWLAYTFIEADRASWSNFREVGLYQLTAEAIKAARQHGLIAEADIWGSDESLWQKLQAAQHPAVSKFVKQLTPGTRFIWNESQPAFKVRTKVRSIDPPVSNGSLVRPLSELDPVFAQYRNAYLNAKQGQWQMAIVQGPHQQAESN